MLLLLCCVGKESGPAGIDFAILQKRIRNSEGDGEWSGSS